MMRDRSSTITKKTGSHFPARKVMNIDYIYGEDQPHPMNPCFTDAGIKVVR